MMKRSLFFIMSILVFLASSCKKEEEYPTYNIGSDYKVKSDGFTILDNSVVLKVSGGYNVSSVTVTHMGGLQADGETAFTVSNTNLGTIAVSSGVGSITVPEASVGMSQLDWTSDLRFTAIAADGTPIYRPITIAVNSPFSIEAPTLTQKDEDVDFSFEVAPATQAVTGVTIETKVAFDGTYVAIPGTFEAIDTIQLNGSGYSVGDTIYVKLTATTAVKTASIVTKVPVEYYTFPLSKMVRLTPLAATSIYDLEKGRYIDAANEVAMLDSVDIKYVKTNIVGGFTLGFTAPKNAEFVKLTGTVVQTDSIFGLGNAVTTQAIDFSSSVTDVFDVSVDDVYAFRTQRGTSDYIYGMIKIATIKKPDGDPLKSYFDFELKYGK